MQKISTRTHGIIDYATGATLLAAPNLFGFSHNRTASMVARAIGLGILGQSLFTNYELGAVKAVPMQVHLNSDMATGALLAASPWLFGFSDDSVDSWLPHVLVGMSEIAVAAATDPDSNTVSGATKLPARIEDTRQSVLGV